MGKHEAPAFKMVIENARLVPATAYDEERLQTYRRGTRVSVRFTEEKDRTNVRKWFAIIGKAVKECNTPWQTKDQASEAIKLSLGIVNLSKTVTGAFMQYPKSLTELTDPELEEAVEQMTAIIQHITGVDPADWRKEIADLGEDENTEPSDESPYSDDAGVDAGTTPNGVDSDLPAQADQPGEELEPSATSPSGSTTLSEEDKRNLGDFIVRLCAAVGPDVEVITMARNSFAAEKRPLSQLAKEKAQTITGYFRDVCSGAMEAADAIELACGIAGVEASELGV